MSIVPSSCAATQARVRNPAPKVCEHNSVFMPKYLYKRTRQSRLQRALDSCVGLFARQEGRNPSCLLGRRETVLASVGQILFGLVGHGRISVCALLCHFGCLPVSSSSVESYKGRIHGPAVLLKPGSFLIRKNHRLREAVMGEMRGGCPLSGQ